MVKDRLGDLDETVAGLSLNVMMDLAEVPLHVGLPPSAVRLWRGSYEIFRLGYPTPEEIEGDCLRRNSILCVQCRNRVSPWQGPEERKGLSGA